MVVDLDADDARFRLSIFERETQVNLIRGNLIQAPTELFSPAQKRAKVLAVVKQDLIQQQLRCGALHTRAVEEGFTDGYEAMVLFMKDMNLATLDYYYNMVSGDAAGMEQFKQTIMFFKPDKFSWETALAAKKRADDAGEAFPTVSG